MSKPYVDFEPKWVKEAAPSDSYRSIFRWGDPNFVKYPKESLYKLMKEKFRDHIHYNRIIRILSIRLRIWNLEFRIWDLCH